MKDGRQDEIIRIISEQDVETQEELRELLYQSGYAATQATVSRDIRELKIVKVSIGNGRYKYVAQEPNDTMLQDKYTAILRQAVRSVDCAMNIVVVNVYVGMGGAVGAAIDSLKLGGIIGSVAGDDTIIMVAKTPEDAAEACEHLREVGK